ncbi:YqzL family protein [Bacillus solimangrovi]
MDLTWKIFSETGDLGIYLLMKEIERDSIGPEDESEELAEIQTPFS